MVSFAAKVIYKVPYRFDTCTITHAWPSADAVAEPSGCQHRHQPQACGGPPHALPEEEHKPRAPPALSKQDCPACWGAAKAQGPTEPHQPSEPAPRPTLPSSRLSRCRSPLPPRPPLSLVDDDDVVMITTMITFSPYCQGLCVMQALIPGVHRRQHRYRLNCLLRGGVLGGFAVGAVAVGKGPRAAGGQSTKRRAHVAARQVRAWPKAQKGLLLYIHTVI